VNQVDAEAITLSNDFQDFSSLVVVFVRFLCSVFDLPKGVFVMVNQAEPMGRRFGHRFVFKGLRQTTWLMSMDSEQSILLPNLSWTLVEPSAFAFFQKRPLGMAFPRLW